MVRPFVWRAFGQPPCGREYTRVFGGFVPVADRSAVGSPDRSFTAWPAIWRQLPGALFWRRELSRLLRQGDSLFQRERQSLGPCCRECLGAYLRLQLRQALRVIHLLGGRKRRADREAQARSRREQADRAFTMRLQKGQLRNRFQRVSQAAPIPQFPAERQALLLLRPCCGEISLPTGDPTQQVERDGDVAPVLQGAPYRQALLQKAARPLIIALLMRQLPQVVQRCGDTPDVAQFPPERQALLIVAPSRRIVALIGGQNAQIAERPGLAETILRYARSLQAPLKEPLRLLKVAPLLGDDRQAAQRQGCPPHVLQHFPESERLLRLRLRGRRIALVVRQHTGPEQRLRPQALLSLRNQRQQPVQVGAPLAEIAVDLPELPQRARQPQSAHHLQPVLHGHLQRQAEIIVVGLQAFQPARLFQPHQFRCGALRQRYIESAMACAGVLPLALLPQPLYAILPDGFQQTVAGLAVAPLRQHQRFAHQAA